MLDRLGVSPGDDVVVDEVDGAVLVRRRRSAADLFGVLGAGTALDDLARSRSGEREREAARARRR
jgi:hypothetical protein